MLAALSLTLLAALQGPATGLRADARAVTAPIRATASSAAMVHGQVRSEGNGAPLRGAVVELVASGVSIIATTDTLGNYILKNVPVGRRLLRATHIDHAPLEVEIIVSDRVAMELDFALELRPVKLPAVTAHALSWKSNNDTMGVGTAALGQANVKALEATPGVAELGLADLTREVPGQEPPDPSDILYVRGGTTDLKLVLLNGAPVYAPFHLGGLINPLDGDLIRAARLYVGGAPARYDGGLSYVMDLETRAGRSKQSHVSAGVDLLSSRTVFEGPITHGVTYLFGARAVHGMGAQAFTQEAFPYGYADAIGRMDFDIGDARVTATGFWNQESVRLDSAGGAVHSAAKWGNTSGSLRFRGNILGADADIVIADGEFNTQLPVGGVRPIITDGLADRRRAAADFTRNYKGAFIQFGGSLDRQHYEFEAWPQSATRDSILLRSTADGNISGFYVDAQVQPARRITVRGGLRGDVFSIDPRLRVAPRFAATLLLTDKASLTMAAGRYRQYVRAERASFSGTPVPDSIGKPALAIAQASHLVLSLDQQLGEGLRLALEGYYKTFKDLPSMQGELTEASGVDLWVRRATGRFNGWLGYSLAWLWSTDGTATTTSQSFVGRQLLSAGAGGPLGTNGRFDVHLAYGAGLPFTAIPEPEASPPVFVLMRAREPTGSVPDDNFNYPAPPDEQYLRVDVEVSHTFITDVRGFAFELMPYFKLLNALDRRDALFYHFDRSQQQPQARAIAALPVLPVVGFEWRF